MKEANQSNRYRRGEIIIIVILDAWLRLRLTTHNQVEESANEHLFKYLSKRRRSQLSKVRKSVQLITVTVNYIDTPPLCRQACNYFAQKRIQQKPRRAFPSPSISKLSQTKIALEEDDDEIPLKVINRLL